MPGHSSLDAICHSIPFPTAFVAGQLVHYLWLRGRKAQSPLFGINVIICGAFIFLVSMQDSDPEPAGMQKASTESWRRQAEKTESIRRAAEQADLGVEMGKEGKRRSSRKS
eukprot:3477098-Rhodomonas_salina.1